MLEGDLHDPEFGKGRGMVCGYANEASTFDALQRTATSANTVKFQAGPRLVVVKWNGGSREEIRALLGALQRTLK